MSIWTRIAEAIAALAKGAPLSTVFAKLRTPPERTVAFTIAVIALGAKMAKADGRVTRDEVAAFREVFTIPREDEASAARIFNLARQDVTGFEGYARQIAGMFRDRPAVLADLLEGLFHIAAADGVLHPGEVRFLAEVAAIFEIGATELRAIRARHVPGGYDPYAVLGVDPGIGDEALGRRRRELVRELHPDRMFARGVPAEAERIATQRLAAVNTAYEAIKAERARTRTEVR